MASYEAVEIADISAEWCPEEKRPLVDSDKKRKVLSSCLDFLQCKVQLVILELFRHRLLQW